MPLGSYGSRARRHFHGDSDNDSHSDNDATAQSLLTAEERKYIPRKFNFRWFRPREQLPKHGIIVFTGKTGSGKSVTMEDILYYYSKRVDFCYAFVGSQDTADRLSTHIPGLFVFTDWEPDKIQHLYDMNESRIALGERPLEVVVLIDDFAYKKSAVFKSEIIRRLAYNSRHAHFLTMLSTQYCKDLPSEVRENTALVAVCANKNPNQRERIYEAYNPGFDHFQDFNQCMLKMTRDYGVMILKNDNSGDYDLKKSVFKYKAKLNREYKVGERGPMWRFHKRYYDPMYMLRGLSKHKQREAKERYLQKLKEQAKKRRFIKPIPGNCIINIEKRRHPKKAARFYRS